MRDYTHEISTESFSVYQELEDAKQKIKTLEDTLFLARRDRNHFKAQLKKERDRVANEYIKRVNFKQEMALHLMKAKPDMKRKEIADLCCLTESAVNKTAIKFGITKNAKRKSSS